MKNINSLIKDKNNEFISKLFNNEIIIAEKLSAVNFSFIKDIDGEFRFYKKGVSFPINFYQRTFSGLYEKAISFVLNLSETVKKEIPLLYRFQFEYFPSNRPNYIHYKKLPLNNLVLTGVFEYDQFGKIKQIFNNYNDLNHWADLLAVERPPIIFQGKLSPQQKNNFLKFVHENPSESFFKKFIEITNIEQKTTLLGNNIDEFINGLHITFKDDDKLYHVKMIDPAFEQYVSSNKIKNKSSILPIFYSEIISYFSINQSLILNYDIKSDDKIRGYIELIYHLFKEFINDNGDKFTNVKITTLPEFFVSDDYSINLDRIEDDEILELVKSNKIYQSLLKIFLNLFKKERNINDHFINQNLLKYQHQITKIIRSKIEVIGDAQVNEANTFLKFLELANNDIYQYNFGVDIEEDIEEDIEDILKGYEQPDELLEEEPKEIITIEYNEDSDFFLHLRNKDIDFKNSVNKAILVVGSYPMFIDGFLEFIQTHSTNKIYFYNIRKSVYNNEKLFDIVHNHFVASDEVLGNNILADSFDYRILQDKISTKHIIKKIIVPDDTKEYYKNIFEYYKMVDPSNFTDEIEIEEIPAQYYIDDRKHIKELINEITGEELFRLLDTSIKHLQFEISSNILEN